MVIKRRDLVNLSRSEFEFVGERHDMRKRDVVIGILNEMQELDEEVPAARRVGQQRLHLRQGRWIYLAAAFLPSRFALAFAHVIPLVEA